MVTAPALDSEAFRAELLHFFDAHARNLPWRTTADPYPVWVSEIMLQQTRVETAVPYFVKWMARFPTITSLAVAPIDSVLEAWAGLGYYSRARNLHRAAIQVREQHGGKLPADVDGLRTLPGIGEYTAGAIASIAYGVAAPAVDGNVRRVLSRIFDIENPTTAVLRAHASGLVDPTRPGDFNQALMELGATVCTPRTPRCDDCPVARHCRALERGTVSQRPRTRPAKAVPQTAHAVAVLRFGSECETYTLLCRRPPSGLLGGMLEFPSTELTKGARPGLAEAVARAANAVGTDPGEPRPLEPVPHRFSHIAATYYPFVFDLAEPPSEALSAADSAFLSVDWEDLTAAALPAAQRRIARAAEGTLTDVEEHMKWLVRGAVALVAVLGGAFGIGAFLPVEHAATVSRDLSASPETVWTVLTDLPAMPEWRSGLDSIERLADRDGLPSWTETSGSEALTFETIEMNASELLVTRIATEGIPFGGTWRIGLEPSDQGTEVRITENGEVYNAIYRFVSRFVVGHDATMNKYLDDLERYLGS